MLHFYTYAGSTLEPLEVKQEGNLITYETAKLGTLVVHAQRPSTGDFLWIMALAGAAVIGVAAVLLIRRKRT